MEVEYIKGLGCPVNINWGKENTAITIKDAKQLQAKLAEVIEQAEKEPELSEFENAVEDLCWKVGIGEYVYTDDIIKKKAAELLELARKEIVKEETNKNAIGTMLYDAGFEDGKEAVLEDLPRWKKKEEDKFGYYCSCGFLVSDGYEISIAELKRKLPRVEED